MDRFLKAGRSCFALLFRDTRNHFVRPKFRSIVDMSEATQGRHYWRNSSDYLPNSAEFCSVLPAILAGSFLGASMFDTCYAESPSHSYASSQPGAYSGSWSDNSNIEKIVRQERERLEEELRNKGMQRGSYPSFVVAAKGSQVSIKFRIPPTGGLSHVIKDLVSHLGQKTDQQGEGFQMTMSVVNSSTGGKLLLNLSKDKFSDESQGSLDIIIAESGTGSYTEIEFVKQGTFSVGELEALAIALKVAGSISQLGKDLRPRNFSETIKGPNEARRSVDRKTLGSLESMGVKVFGRDGFDEVEKSNAISWDIIAGYDEQKREIEDTVLLALTNPEVYDAIAHGTRRKFESNRPRAVLFEGPPGTGKTSCARVIANQASVPLLYVPLEAVMSKYYGESERLLGTVFTLANELSSGAIVFLDEVDSFAATRDSEMHEATRRILSVLLRQIDGFEQEKQVVVIAATNRKQDLDPALISRFDSVIRFGLPDHQDRLKIIAQYAKHLDKDDLAAFASLSEGMSGRDIRDVCQQAERHWASKIIRDQTPSDAPKDHLPPLEEYLDSIMQRRQTLMTIREESCKLNSGSDKQRMTFGN